VLVLGTPATIRNPFGALMRFKVLLILHG